MAHLIRQKKMPDDGWSEEDILFILSELSAMDSNQFESNCGVGEREGRIFSRIVGQRHFGFAHGIGRSGDICETQPKAAGSSVVQKLTCSLVKDLIRRLGVRSCAEAFIAPVATGMAVTLTLLALRSVRKEAKYVLWSRIDQKSCFKVVYIAG